MADNPKSKGWFEQPENVRKIIRALFIACGFFVLADVVLWLAGVDKHPYFEWETWPGFYAVFGFVGCVLLVFGGKYVLRPLVKRGEDYYEKNNNTK